MNLIPKIRFSEFKNEWNLVPLGDVTNIYDGTHQTPKYVDSGIPFVSVENINDIENTDKFITPEAFEKDYKIKPEKNDILMTRITAGKIGATAIVKNNKPLAYYVSLALIRIKKDYEISADFLEQRINSVYFQHELHKRIIHIAFPKKINLGEIGFCKITFPELKEQQKIASFLTACDDRTKLLQNQKDQLILYKKGLMEEIFSHKLLFTDANGKKFPDWKYKKLGEIGSTFNGLTGKTKDHFGYGKPYIQYMQIFRNSKIDINDFGLVEISSVENQSKVKYGDIFFTTSSETPNEIGTASVLLDEVDEVYLNSFCFGFRPNSLNELVPEFAQFFFRSPHMRDKIIPLAQGSTRFNMSKVELMKISIYLPSKEEQQKIAVFLSGIENQIDNVINQIDGHQKFKKGLLQQMFI